MVFRITCFRRAVWLACGAGFRWFLAHHTGYFAVSLDAFQELAILWLEPLALYVGAIVLAFTLVIGLIVSVTKHFSQEE